MILVQRYVFKELLYKFIFCFVVISAVVLLAKLLVVLYQYPMLGLDMVAAFVPYLLLGMMAIVLPLSVIVAVVSTYGRMAADNEVVALKASGVHLFKVVVPALLFGVLTSFMLLVVNDRFIPLADVKIKTMGKEQNIYPLLENILKRGLTKLELGELLITWESYEKAEAGSGGEEDRATAWRFKGFRAKKYDEDGNLEKEIIAESALIMVSDKEGRRIDFQLTNAREVVGGDAQFGKITLPHYELDSRKSKVRLGHRTLSALFALLEKEVRPYGEGRILTEIHSRFTQSMSPLIFVFLGLPIAIIFRYRSIMVAFLISLLIAIFIYFPVMRLGETFAKKEILHPALCIWPGSLLMLAGGMWLLLSVTRK